MKKTINLIIFSMLICSVFTISPSFYVCEAENGNILYVGGTDSGNYIKIQGAINDASDGDTVFVYSGIYHEHLIIDKSILLIGENKNSTIIDGSNSGTVVLIDANDVTFTGFTVQNSGSNTNRREGDAGIKTDLKECVYTGSGNNNITGRNTIYGNTVVNCACGIWLNLCSYDNLVSENTVYNNTDGIRVGRYANKCVGNNTISKNIIFQNVNGIDVEGTYKNSIVENTISNNSKDGIYLYGSDGNMIIGNTVIENHRNGIYLRYADDNFILSNIAANNSGNGILLTERTNGNTISKNTISNNDRCGLYIPVTPDLGLGRSLDSPVDNLIFHNDFLNNKQHAEDGCNNIWDNGYPSGGNYWDDYTGNDDDFDGIGDLPYNIAKGNNQDGYPKMAPNSFMVNASGPYTGIVNISLQFNSSASGGTPPYNWLWNFGDNTTSNYQYPSHMYNNSGEYIIRLIVTDSENKTKSDIAFVTIKYMEIGAYGPYTGAINSPIQFKGSVYGGIPPYNWSWDFGDGNTSNVQNSTHTYRTKGNYIVSLTVTDSTGLSEIDTALANIIFSTVYVDDDYDESTPGWDVDHFAAIQKAIDTVDFGDTVFVFNGTYNENIIVSKTINLFGEHKNSTMINGTTYGNVVTIYSDGVNINGFTIQRSRNTGFLSIYSDYFIPSSEISYRSSIYPYYHTSNYKGIQISSSYNIISGNIIKNSSYGIGLGSSSHNTILNNHFVLNGIYFEGTSLDYWNTHTIENNYANDKTVYYYKNNSKGVIVPSDTGQIILANCTNFTINNLDIADVDGGIQLGFSSYNNIFGNTIINSITGIRLSESPHNNINENAITNNSYGIYLSDRSNSNIISQNNITDNNQGISLYSSSDNEINKNTVLNHSSYAFYQTGSSHNNFKGNTIINNSYAIYLTGSSHNNIISENNIANNNNYGLYLYDTSDNEIIENTISNHSSYAIYQTGSSHNNFKGNTIINNSYAIYLTGSSHNNIISENNIANNQYGLYLYTSSENEITKNTVSNHTSYSIYLTDSSHNDIYHNAFINSTMQAYDENTNTWYNPTLQRGNFWDDYNGTDSDGDGIGDTSYNISGNDNQDLYPLMEIYGKRIDKEVIPGFELLVTICCIALVIFWKRKRMG